MKKQDMLGAGLVVVGIALLNNNPIAGWGFIGFGLGYNIRPHLSKLFKNEKSKK